MAELSFTQEFLRHAAATSGWPPEASVSLWCQDKHFRFMRHGYYAKVARGDFVAERYIELIVNYLLDPRHLNFAERRSLNTFLSQNGVADPGRVTGAQVVKLVSIDNDAPEDGLFGAEVLLWIFRRVLKPQKHLRLISYENEVQLREAVGWMYVEAGRQLESPDLPEFQALQVAKAKIGLSLDEYQDLAVSWWRKNQWCIVHTVGDKDVTGMAIALPVTESFYTRARGGLCKTSECTAQDILPESPFIIIEGVAPRPDIDRRGGPGLSLIMAMVCQEARLSDVPGICRTVPLRLLTFSGTPVGKKRAKKFGYTPLGTFWPGTKIEYMERLLELSAKRPVDAAYVGIWLGVQLLLRDIYRDRPRGDESPEGDPPETE